MSWKILLIMAGCIKGFVYRFMYVLVSEKMAGKLIRHPDSVFDGFPNMYFKVDFKTELEENKSGDVENTQKAANEEQRCFTPKDLLQKIFMFTSRRNLCEATTTTSFTCITVQVHTVLQKLI